MIVDDRKMVRKMLPADIDAVMDIWLQVNCSVHAFIDEKYWQDNYGFVQQALNDADVLVFTEGSTIKGFIGIVGNYLAGLFVVEEFQKSGIGGILIAACKEKHSCLELSVFKKNDNAVNFYKKQNFVVQEEKLDIQTQEIEYSMVWCS